MSAETGELLTSCSKCVSLEAALEMMGLSKCPLCEAFVPAGAPHSDDGECAASEVLDL